MKKIILASWSPRRKQLLEWAGVPFEIVVKETDECYPADLAPGEVALHIARNKAMAVRDSIDNSLPVLAADTIVVIDGKILGKPADKAEAVSMLKLLSGKKHLVITGVCIAYNGTEILFSDTTEVAFHELTDEQINFYVDTFSPYDKAGAYAIQEWIGVIGIRSVNGDFYNVMGLPVSRVVKELNLL